MKIVAVGDTHFPFSANHVIRWIIQDIIAPDPTITHIIQVGDLYDLMSYSRFPKRLLLTPQDEVSKARDMAEYFWKRMRDVAPQATRHQILGNHDARLSKRVVEVMPELDHLIRYKDLWSFDNVITTHDERDELVIGDWTFIHGHTKFTKHIEAVDFKNVCTGHTHRGGQHAYRLQIRNQPRILQELNCGYVGNPFHEALTYRPLNKYFGWTWGCGVIDEHGGRFIPYPGKRPTP